MNDVFTNAERARIHQLLATAEKPPLRQILWPYASWILISLVFGLLFLKTRDGAVALAAYLALLVPYLIGACTAKKKYQDFAKLIVKYDALCRGATGRASGPPFADASGDRPS